MWDSHTLACEWESFLVTARSGGVRCLALPGTKLWEALRLPVFSAHQQLGRAFIPWAGAGQRDTSSGPHPARTYVSNRRLEEGWDDWSPAPPLRKPPEWGLGTASAPALATDFHAQRCLQLLLALRMIFRGFIYFRVSFTTFCCYCLVPGLELTTSRLRGRRLCLRDKPPARVLLLLLDNNSANLFTPSCEREISCHFWWHFYVLLYYTQFSSFMFMFSLIT